MTASRFLTKNGLDNNANSITNIGVTGASFTLAGANALTMTTTGATSVTLPTSGTLVNSTGTISTATNLAGGANGSIAYQTGSGVTTFLAAGTNTHVLTLTGGVPTWVAPSGGGGLTTTDDTSTNATYYPVFVTAIAGSTAKMSSTKLQFNPSTGTSYATVFQSLSDAQFKTNVKALMHSDEVIDQLSGVSFDWRDGTGSSYGFIAQDVQKVLPHAVSETESNMSLNYSAIIPFLVETIKNQNKRIATLEQAMSRLVD